MKNEEIIDQAKDSWKLAGNYPLNKSAIYPEHEKVQEFDLHKDKVVLEYGSGSGADAYEYLRRGNSVVLADIVKENLAKARQNLEYLGLCDNAIFLPLESSYPIPLQDSAFDLVNSHGVIHHIPEAPEVIKEFYRILKNDGLCYIMLYSEHLGFHFGPQIKPLMQQYPNIKTKEEAFCWLVDGYGTPYAIPYTEEEGRKLLTDAGFEVLSTTLFNNDFFRTYKAIKH